MTFEQNTKEHEDFDNLIEKYQMWYAAVDLEEPDGKALLKCHKVRVKMSLRELV